MNAYNRRQAEERERQRAYMVRRSTEKRAERMEHANAVIREYEDAYKTRYALLPVPDITFDPATGYYYVRKNDKMPVTVNRGTAMREDTLKEATRFMYASAHERDMAGYYA